MNKEEFNILAKAFIQKPEEVVHSIIEDLEKCSQISQGYQNVLDNWDKVESNEDNLVKQLKTSVKTVKGLCEMNRRMALLLMVYAMGNNFSSDAAHVMMKLGNGEDALRELLKSKMKRK